MHIEFKWVIIQNLLHLMNSFENVQIKVENIYISPKCFN